MDDLQTNMPRTENDISFFGFRLDLLINNQVIVEAKTIDLLLDIHHKQLLTYLKVFDKNWVTD